MTAVESGLWLVSALIGSLILILLWSVPRMSSTGPVQAESGTRTDVLHVLLIFASFATGVFVTYMLLGLRI